MKFTLLTTLFSIFIFTNLASASPRYCKVENIRDYIVDYEDINTLHRGLVLKFGEVVIAGYGVGNTIVKYGKRVAKTYSRAKSSNKHCTWYYNKSWYNPNAEKAFHHFPLTNPRKIETPQKAASHFMDNMKSNFFQDNANFIKCAREQNFIGMGCNGMKHRGPSIFGMLLAFSGCSTEDSLNVANTIWDLNGVPLENRRAIIEAANQYGQQNPIQRITLQTLLSN